MALGVLLLVVSREPDVHARVDAAIVSIFYRKETGHNVVGATFFQ